MKTKPLAKCFRVVLTSLALAGLLCSPALANLGQKNPAPNQDEHVKVRVRNVWPLYYFSDGKTRGGGSKQLVVRVSRAHTGDVRVGFFESAAMGSGLQWRAGGWMAVVIAGFYSGRDASNWRISFECKGRMDGPSAGGLMTSAVLSAMLNHRFLPHVTMTGTINPDGSIGPVGGIYYKLAGAKAVGMKKVLIPAGCSPEKLPTGQVKDLHQRARQLGLILVEVRDIYQAYRHLTGHSLRAYKDDGRNFTLPQKAQKAIGHAYRRWLGVFNDRIKRMGKMARQVPKKYKSYLGKIWAQAYKEKNRAETAHKAGKELAAWGLMLRAATFAETGAQLSQLGVAFGKGGQAAGLKTLQRLRIKGPLLESFLAKISRLAPKNMNDLLAISEAYGLYDAALGITMVTGNLMNLLKKPHNDDQAITIMSQIIRMQVQARVFFNLVDDYIYMGFGHPGPRLPKSSKLLSWAKAMLRASEANLLYIENTIVSPAAQQMKVAPALFKMKLMSIDYSYQMATYCRGALNVLQKFVPPDARRAMAVLGGASASFAMSSVVVAKYYNLGIRRKKTGQVYITKKKRLANMLASAESQLRDVLLRAAQRGWKPVMPVFRYQLAKELESFQSDLPQKLWALSEYWQGSLSGRLFLALPDRVRVGAAPGGRRLSLLSAP